jgi:hypothetical protein
LRLVFWRKYLRHTTIAGKRAPTGDLRRPRKQQTPENPGFV